MAEPVWVQVFSIRMNWCVVAVFVDSCDSLWFFLPEFGVGGGGGVRRIVELGPDHWRSPGYSC